MIVETEIYALLICAKGRLTVQARYRRLRRLVTLHRIS